MSDQTLSAAKIDEIKALVDRYLQDKIDQLPEHPTKLAEAMKYALLGGGKRMRPLLCFLVADTLDVSTQVTLTKTSTTMDTTALKPKTQCIPTVTTRGPTKQGNNKYAKQSLIHTYCQIQARSKVWNTIWNRKNTNK